MTDSQKELIKKQVNILAHNEDNFCTNNYGSLQWQELGYEVTFSPHVTEETLHNFLNFILKTIENERNNGEITH